MHSVLFWKQTVDPWQQGWGWCLDSRAGRWPGRGRREAPASTGLLRPLGEVEAAARAPQLHRPKACLIALSSEDGRSALT